MKTELTRMQSKLLIKIGISETRASKYLWQVTHDSNGNLLSKEDRKRPWNHGIKYNNAKSKPSEWRFLLPTEVTPIFTLQDLYQIIPKTLMASVLSSYHPGITSGAYNEFPLSITHFKGNCHIQYALSPLPTWEDSEVINAIFKAIVGLKKCYPKLKI